MLFIAIVLHVRRQLYNGLQSLWKYTNTAWSENTHSLHLFAKQWAGAKWFYCDYLN